MLAMLERKVSHLMEAQPFHADRLVLLARLRGKLGDEVGSADAFDRAVRINPRLHNTHLNSAACPNPQIDAKKQQITCLAA